MKSAKIVIKGKMLRKNLNLVTLIILLATLPACYKEAHTRYQSPTISYEFDEPREYCQRELSESGLRMQCWEIPLSYLQKGSQLMVMRKSSNLFLRILLYLSKCIHNENFLLWSGFPNKLGLTSL